MPTAYNIDERYELHTLSNHPENASRLIAIQDLFDAHDLLTGLLIVPAQPVADEDLLAVHQPEHLTRLRQFAGRSVMFGPDTYAVPCSYETARLAAGGVRRVVETVLDGEADNGLAAIRPPGHHATPTAAMGFCLLNNIAVGARFARRQYDDVQRVAIVDYDVHHGNGTQDIFYTDPSVLYISLHQSPLYPGTGHINEVGAGTGSGYTLNIPMQAGVGDGGYALMVNEVVIPALRRFEPDLLLVSAGFDAHWSDPLAGMQLSLRGYDYLTRQLIAVAQELCQGRIIFVLEGGYNLQALSNAWVNVAHALLGRADVVDPLGPAHGKETGVQRLCDHLQQLHKLA
ncbi:MAG: histone deacetylase [Chloroflexi bacterium]|nr:histone deacetylase [Chloroflexota bacterium]